MSLKSSAWRMQTSRNRRVCPLAVNWTSLDGYAPGPSRSTDSVTHSSPRMQSPFDAATYHTFQGIRSTTSSIRKPPLPSGTRAFTRRVRSATRRSSLNAKTLLILKNKKAAVSTRCHLAYPRIDFQPCYHEETKEICIAGNCVKSIISFFFANPPTEHEDYGNDGKRP